MVSDLNSLIDMPRKIKGFYCAGEIGLSAVNINGNP